MGKKVFKLAGGAVRLLSHRMTTTWEVPFEEGPCVFVANYVGAYGPVDMCVKFPLREKIHPWINSELLKAGEIPAYMKKEYLRRNGAVMKQTVPYIGAAFIPPILKGVDYIPVYNDQRSITTFRQSIRMLQKGHYLLIFPEIPSGWKKQQDKQGGAIYTGWLRLGELWYRASGRALKIYPVHVDTKKHEFNVAAPVWYEPDKRFQEQENTLAEKLVKGIQGV